MSTAKAISRPPATAAERHDIRMFLDWLTDGWRLFLRAPLKLFGLMLLLFAIEILIQAGIPLLGVPVSKWALGMLGGIYWLALDQLDAGGRLRPIRAARRIGDKWPALAGLALLALLVYFLQVGVGYLMLGPHAIDLLVFSKTTSDVPLSTAQMGLIFSAGVPFSTLLMFATPLLLIERISPGRAIVASMRVVTRHAVPMGLLALLTMVCVFLAPVTFLLSIVLTGPWLLCVGLVAYRRIGQPPEDVM